MELKKVSNWLLAALLLIIGGISGQLIEQIFGQVFNFNTLPQQILVICSVFIIFLIVIVVYLQRMDRKIENTLSKLIKPFVDEIPCSFLGNQEERLQKITNYINIAKKQIFIFSNLAEKKETDLKEHQNYLNALNLKLRDREIKFLRIIVPDFNTSEMKDQDIKEEMKKLIAYKEHFKKIFELRTTEETLIVDKNGEQGISIMMIDERYLFIIIEKKYKHPVLANILEGGLFFEDIGKKLTVRFTKFFEARKDRIVIG